MQRISVLIVDDSAVVRQVLTGLLAQDPGIEVLPAAADPLFAMERMKMHWPDVIVLDIEMPRMDGITFLRRLMEERPTPVVICSTLTERGAETTIQALSAGAVEIVTKPRVGLKSFLSESAQALIRAVKSAAHARPRRSAGDGRRIRKESPSPPSGRPASVTLRTTERVVAIGTSTGGTQALEVVLPGLSRVCPGMVVVQHMPEKFTGAFARRLDGLCEVDVKEAQSGDRVIAGRVLIAPGGRHMQLKRSGAQYHVEVSDGPPVNRHRPSVDVLFRSVAQAAGRNALGIIMTGMGDDGARGLREMRDEGARTIAQDEESCIVYGMPKEAMKLEAAAEVLPLQRIAAAVEAFGRDR